MSQDEPEYVDADDPFHELPKLRSRPKWMLPDSNYEKRILDAVGRKYYKARYERTQVLQITKAMLPLAKAGGGRYPVEWVEVCCKWAEKQRKSRRIIQLPGLLSLINREEAMKEWKELQPGNIPKGKKQLFKSGGA